MLEYLGIVFLLLLIVWIVYRYYGAPESEYMKVLDELEIQGYDHLDTQTLEKEIEATKRSLNTLEASILKVKRRRAKRKLQAQHHFEEARLALLQEALDKRQNIH